MRKNERLDRFVRFNYCNSIKQVGCASSVTLITVNTVLSEMAVRLFYVRVNGDIEQGARNIVIVTRHAYLVTVQFWYSIIFAPL